MPWSLSSLGTYEKCGLKWKFKYVDRLPEARSTQANRGVDHHKSVEDFLTGASAALPDELGFYSQFFTGLKQYEIYPEHKISLSRDWNKTAWDSSETWYRGVLDLKLISSYGEVEKENCEDCTSVRYPTTAVVYDWKTGKIYPDHDDQKSLYSLALFSEHPTLQSVRAVHVYLDLNANREKTFHADQVHDLRKQWETRVQRLEQDPVLIPNPGFHCRWCGFSRSKGGPCQF